MKTKNYNKLTRGVFAVVAGASLASLSAMGQTYTNIPYAHTGTQAPAGNALLLVADGGDVQVTYVHGINYGDEDILWLGGTQIFDNRTATTNTVVDLGIFAAGTVLNFTLQDLKPLYQNTWNMGLGSGNSDGAVHAYVVPDANLNGGTNTYVGWEDRPVPSADLNYNDLAYTFTAVSVTPAPEPTTLALAALGGASLLLLRRRK